MVSLNFEIFWNEFTRSAIQYSQNLQLEELGVT